MNLRHPKLLMQNKLNFVKGGTILSITTKKILFFTYVYIVVETMSSSLYLSTVYLQTKPRSVIQAPGSISGVRFGSVKEKFTNLYLPGWELIKILRLISYEL